MKNITKTPYPANVKIDLDPTEGAAAAAREQARKVERIKRDAHVGQPTPHPDEKPSK